MNKTAVTRRKRILFFLSALQNELDWFPVPLANGSCTAAGVGYIAGLSASILRRNEYFGNGFLPVLAPVNAGNVARGVFVAAHFMTSYVHRHTGAYDRLRFNVGFTLTTDSLNLPHGTARNLAAGGLFFLGDVALAPRRELSARIGPRSACLVRERIAALGLDIDTANDWPSAMPAAAWANPPPDAASGFDRLALVRTELKPALQVRLATNGINTVGDIARKKRHDVARLPNVGHVAIARIEAMLAGLGYPSAAWD